MCLKIVASLVLFIPAIQVLGKSASCSLSEPDISSSDAGECLLASGSRMSRALSRSSSSLGVSAGMHRAWLIEHKKLRKAANESTGALDMFIKAQNSSSDACSSRLMESKRVLDGLLKDLKAIEEQVESHEELLQTETENLNITHNAIDAAETIYDGEIEECEKLKDDAHKDLEMYNAELQELEQIADPKVRYEHSVKVTLPEKGEKFNAADDLNNSALLEQGVFSMSSCNAFKAFSLQSKILSFTNVKNLTCDEQREELQKAFTEAYITVQNLIKDATERGEDKSCFEAAEAKRTSALVPLTSQREQASARIEYSTQALAMLQPVLNLLKGRVEKLQEHINETLTPECKEAAKVSETLNAVRELIISLEKCPGRNDFRLKIPDTNPPSATPEESTAAASPATAASALQRVAVNSETQATSAKDPEKLVPHLVTAKSNATAKVLQPDIPTTQTVVMKPDVKPAVSALKTAKVHHHHNHHKHAHEHARSEVQEHGEVRQIDDRHDSEVNDTKHKETEKQDDGSISITVESTSV